MSFRLNNSIAVLSRLTVGSLMLLVTGCNALPKFDHLDAIPAHRVPPSLLGPSKDTMQTISLSRLRQSPSCVYELGPSDILGVYIETILGNSEDVPPVHYPEGDEQEPAIGYPVPIREDGTIALPLIPPIDIAGLTLADTQELIRKAYTVDRRILPPGRSRIIVTLIRRRKHRVLVVREESGASSRLHNDQEVVKRGAGYVVDLPAYENDLLHALNETGGLPGTDAQNEVVIIRGGAMDAREYDNFVARIKLCQEPCSCPPLIPDAPNVVRVPIRFYPDDPPQIEEQDIILQSGDIVLIESREREKFYTGGVLGGGEYPIPRDYDMDILQAVAVAQGPVGSSGAVLSKVNGGGGSGFKGGGGPLPPTDAIIVRKLCDGGQIPIRVNLKRALNDPRQRVLMQPEDVLIVRYTVGEEVLNTVLSLVQFNFLFNGFRGGF
ncbi:MAG: polysaccharide biosynthesis/export family protein [Planctomycetaceae bacterium]|nr:polysaccharide biosynthesis/export family protein [Planctomycetaceae bacterium]